MPLPPPPTTRNVNGENVPLTQAEIDARVIEQNANYPWPFDLSSVRPDQLQAEVAAQLPPPVVSPPNGTPDEFGLVYSGVSTPITLNFGVGLTQQQQTTLNNIIAAHAPAVSALEKADHVKLLNRVVAALGILASTTVSRSGTATNGQATITGLAKTSDLTVGMQVSAAAGIPNNTKILTIDSATQITMDKNANGSGTASVTFAVATTAQKAVAQGWLDTQAVALLNKLGL